jgi:copper chaperone CopZ
VVSRLFLLCLVGGVMVTSTGCTPSLDDDTSVEVSEEPHECESDESAASETVFLCIWGMSCQGCVAAVEASLSQVDCLVSFTVSLEESGATVEYLKDYVSTQELADQIEGGTSFDVTCQEPVE